MNHTRFQSAKLLLFFWSGEAALYKIAKRFYRLIRIERWANSPDHESSKKKPGILNKWVLTVDKTIKDC